MYLRQASRGDISEIIRLRIQFLKEMSTMPEDLDEFKLAVGLERYLRDHLGRDYINWFAMEGSYIIATGGICFHDYPPSFEFPNCTRAYILNMYTVEAYRRKGIGTKIFEKLLTDARRRKVNDISLHGTEVGKSLYEKFGFEFKQSEMVLSLAAVEPVSPLTFNP